MMNNIDIVKSMGKTAFFAVFIAFLMVAAMPSSVFAQSANCNATADLTYTQISVVGRSATASVTNRSSSCTYHAGLASYRVYDHSDGTDSQSQPFITSQQLNRTDLRNIAPGQTIRVSVALPTCAYQVDLFEGPNAPVPPAFGNLISTHTMLAWKINESLALCGDTPPPVDPISPSCSPSTQTVNIGQAANLSAAGGNGSFSWTSSGNPSFGSGHNFSTVFSTAGTKTVNVTSNGLTDQCTVIVRQPVGNDISCSPSNQNANIGDIVSFNATGGDGGFHWTATGGSPSTGSGSSFHTTYSTSGGKYVLVSDNSGHSAQCAAQINQIIQNAPSCSPSSQSAMIGQNVDFHATGGNGSFSWSAGSGSPSNGTGSSFNTEFNSFGTHVVNVTSNGLTNSCTVHVYEEQNNDLSCSPSDQDADVGDYVTFRASGGSGTYRWTADDGDPSSYTGRNFTTQFDNDGRYTVRVRDSAGNSATCRVDVQDDYYSRRPSCRPSSQTARVNEQVEFFASGGSGNFEWDARDGDRRYGYGSRFTTSFDSPGTYEVELDSNGETDTCEVEVVDDDNGAPFCSPSVQNANVNDFVTFSATGGNGTYHWSTSADGSPSTGSGSSFGTRFITSGNKFVMVTSNGRTSQCLVQIGSVLGASTIVTGPTETAAAAAGLGLLGALGAYGAIYRDRSKKFFSKLARLIRR